MKERFLNWWKNRKIKSLKKKAHNQYEYYSVLTDNYTSGLTLAEHLSPDITEAKRVFNKTLDKLEKLGEPVIRYYL